MLPTVAGQGVSHGNCRYSEQLVKCQSTLLDLIEDAFQLQEMEISGPRSLGENVYSLRAITPPGTTKDTARQMLQQLLSDRFQLKFHREMRQIKVYALLPGKRGVTLQEAGDPEQRKKDAVTVTIDSKPAPAYMASGPGKFYVVAITLDFLSRYYLNQALDTPVVNMTGLTADYKIDLHWTPTQGISNSLKDPGFVSAVTDQLGLRLEKRVLPYNIFCVDSVANKPSEN